jgi:ubiquinone/menaquinone biosynthesis C-methylase UbiE
MEMLACTLRDHMKELILDLGCGTSLQIIDYEKESLIVGIDWDPSFCKISRDKARESGVTAEYLRCDAGHLPFKDEFFDVIYLLDSLRCLKGHSLEWFIKDAYKKLRFR